MVELDAHLGYVEYTDHNEDKGETSPEDQVVLSELEFKLARLGYVDMFINQLLPKYLRSIAVVPTILEMCDHLFAVVFAVQIFFLEPDIPAELCNKCNDPEEWNYGVGYE